MNSRLRWRSWTSAWTLPVSRRSENRLSGSWRLYSCTCALLHGRPGTGGKSGAVVAMAWDPRLLVVAGMIATGFFDFSALAAAFFRTWTSR